MHLVARYKARWLLTNDEDKTEFCDAVDAPLTCTCAPDGKLYALQDEEAPILVFDGKATNKKPTLLHLASFLDRGFICLNGDHLYISDEWNSCLDALTTKTGRFQTNA